MNGLDQLETIDFEDGTFNRSCADARNQVASKTQAAVPRSSSFLRWSRSRARPRYPTGDLRKNGKSRRESPSIPWDREERSHSPAQPTNWVPFRPVGRKTLTKNNSGRVARLADGNTTRQPTPMHWVAAKKTCKANGPHRRNYNRTSDNHACPYAASRFNHRSGRSNRSQNPPQGLRLIPQNENGALATSQAPRVLAHFYRINRQGCAPSCDHSRNTSMVQRDHPGKPR